MYRLGWYCWAFVRWTDVCCWRCDCEECNERWFSELCPIYMVPTVRECQGNLRGSGKVRACTSTRVQKLTKMRINLFKATNMFMRHLIRFYCIDLKVDTASTRHFLLQYFTICHTFDVIIQLMLTHCCCGRGPGCLKELTHQRPCQHLHSRTRCS